MQPKQFGWPLGIFSAIPRKWPFFCEGPSSAKQVLAPACQVPVHFWKITGARAADRGQPLHGCATGDSEELSHRTSHGLKVLSLDLGSLLNLHPAVVILHLNVQLGWRFVGCSRTAAGDRGFGHWSRSALCHRLPEWPWPRHLTTCHLPEAFPIL